MEMLPLLIILFASISLIASLLIVAASKAWNRYHRVFTDTTDSHLQRLFLFADAQKLLLIYLVLALLLPILTYVVLKSLVYVVALIVLILLLPKMLLKRLQTRRRAAISKALPDILAQMAGAMRAGSTFVAAMQSMVDENDGPIRQEFSLLLREIRLGAQLEDALDNLGERVGSNDMDLVISAALIARDVGGNLAEIFTRLSDTLRRKLEMEQKIAALTAQGVLQGWVVSLLPFAILLALSFLEPEALHPLWNSILGWVFLTFIVMLEITGGMVIRKIVSIDI